jgi:hypothetical protein
MNDAHNMRIIIDLRFQEAWQRTETFPRSDDVLCYADTRYGNKINATAIR